MKPKHILLATDLSAAARRAYGPTAWFASKTDARVTLLHVIYAPILPQHGISMGAPISLPNYDRDRKKAEAQLAEEVKSLPSSLDASSLVVVGSKVAVAIVQNAREEGAELIALSTHGRTGIRRFVLGSVAEEVVRRSPVPVLCFPNAEGSEDATTKAIKHILISTDLSAEAMRPLEPVIEFAEANQCRVSVLHVIPELYAIPHGAPLAPPMPVSDSAQQRASARGSIDAQCAAIKQRVQLSTEVTSHLNAAKGIVEYASQNDVDLVALSTHGHTGFRRLALGSVAEQVLRRSAVPVLCFPRAGD